MTESYMPSFAIGCCVALFPLCGWPALNPWHRLVMSQQTCSRGSGQLQQPADLYNSAFASISDASCFEKLTTDAVAQVPVVDQMPYREGVLYPCFSQTSSLIPCAMAVGILNGIDWALSLTLDVYNAGLLSLGQQAATMRWTWRILLPAVSVWTTASGNASASIRSWSWLSWASPTSLKIGIRWNRACLWQQQYNTLTFTTIVIATTLTMVEY